MNLKYYIKYAFFGLLVVFPLNKLVVRPIVVKGNYDEVWVILVNSFPNFAEAIFGIIFVSIILFKVREHFVEHWRRISDIAIYSCAFLITGIYAISQELKFHNFGGNNIYDPNDVVASIIGLVFMYGVLNKYGVIQQNS